MAEVVGILRAEATFGEKETLRYLKNNLPKEFTVYVETPIHKSRDLKYPDFTILTNYGVIVLEVKDWIQVEKATPHHVIVRTRNNQQRQENNPVETARKYAINLSNQINLKRKGDLPGEAIPWSYAAVLPNLPSSVITQLQKVWGDEFVLGRSHLENPDILLSRLKNLFPTERMRPLSREEIDHVRAVIYPIVEIFTEDQRSFVLDEQQEKIVAEPIRVEEPQKAQRPSKQEEQAHQEALFEQLLETTDEEELPQEGKRLVQNFAIRLVRGFSGSGKTLVMIQRAKFLAAQYPDWKIGVFTYNKALQQMLERSFQRTSIKPLTFDALCRSITRVDDPQKIEFQEWLKENRPSIPSIAEFKPNELESEINWIREMGIDRLETYLKIERRGIGRDLRLNKEQRKQIFQICQSYQRYLQTNNRWDWHEAHRLALQKLENGLANIEPYDAVLIDEAQDWAPLWLKVIQAVLKPDGLLFLADDPSQSIYRYFSWKEKGIPVVGRTRWLRVPYRNTFEIYQTAYRLIEDYEEIQQSLAEEGEQVTPLVNPQTMRHGQRPLLRKCRGAVDEINFIAETIQTLRSRGLRDDQIGILFRFKDDVEKLKPRLKGLNVQISTIHAFKGLELEAVFIPALQRTFDFAENDPQKQAKEAQERRLFYMGMSRARNYLYLSYINELPAVFQDLQKRGLVDFVS
ncbi:MAG: UvrD-helicase domain-containing protein [Bellilinea sp.]|nr:UvrD-helicase domain-containing protein [Bellilinea sp.]